MEHLRRESGLAVIWGLIAVVFVLWAGRKFRPAHLGDDILKLEIFRHLRYRNARDAAEHMTYEDLEKRLWIQIGAAFVGCECMFLLLTKSLADSWIFSLTISTTLMTVLLVVFVKRSRTYRLITLPLFATLCRTPQARWDMRARPWNWVKVDLNKGRVWIRLPKDWNATKPHLKAVQELVNTRVPGAWRMESDTQKFLLTFRREIEAQTVLVTGESMGQPVDNVPADFIVMDKDVEDDPW